MGLVVSPSKLDITVNQGASFKLQLRWQYGETAKTALPVDLTTASARAQVRKRYNSATAMLSATSEDDEITLDADGYIYLDVAPEKTMLAVPGSAVWDLEIVWPDGDVCRLVQGAVTISPEATK